MTDGFADLGLSAPLVEMTARLGYHRPTAIQRAAIPVLRRGANVVMHAASGAGVTAAYGLALADRLHETGATAALQALVITPTEERATQVARELGRLGRSIGIRAAAHTPTWSADAAIIAVPVSRVLALIQASTLKLDDLKVLVIDDLSAILSLGDAQVLETLLQTVPRDAQRILVTAELTPEVTKVAEAHVRRALHVPARPAVPEDTPVRGAPTVTIDYYVASGNDALHSLAAAVAAAEATTSVYCRRESDRSTLREEIELRGFSADVKLYGDDPRSSGRSIGYGVPFDVESLKAALGAGGALIIDPRELSHLRELARQANVALRAAAAPAGPSGEVERFLETVRQALEDEDIEAQLLVIAPLLQEHSAAEIAAAATALLRKRTPAAAAPVMAPPASAMASAFVKLFVSIGQRDGIAPREIVGAITGEAGVKGDQIGRVDIRDTFSIVEVAADAADRVIRALNGTSLRGRSLRVDFDRRTGGQRRALPARRVRPAQ